MTVLGVIPARWGSTRLPGKSLLSLAGKPLVQWVFERARLARHLDDLVVATDDQRISDAVEKFGAQAVMTRSDHPSGTDRIAEAAAARSADLVVNIQGDEPLIDPELIDRLILTMLAEPDTRMATAAVPMQQDEQLHNPAIVKVVCDVNGCALYFSRAPVPYHREDPRRIIAGNHLRHLGLYAYRADFLRRFVAEPPCFMERIEQLEQLRALYLGFRIRVVTGADAGVAVDTPEDVPVAEAALRRHIAAGAAAAYDAPGAK